jgi:hypothetical protein
MAKSTCGACANPYTRDHYRILKDTQRKISDLLPLMDKIDRCGAECDAFREIAKELQARLAAIEKEFMSPPPK